MNDPLFRVYYDHPKDFTYAGNPWATPIFGVLVIVERCPVHGRRLVSGGDYYGWYSDEERWRAFDYPGFIQYLHTPGPKRALLGVMADERIWNAVMQKAMTDPEFPVKTGYTKYEIRV